MGRAAFKIVACMLIPLTFLSCHTQPQNGFPVHPGGPGIALGDLTVDRCFFYTEGESFSDKSGGEIDSKDGAYGKKCLGMWWGENLTDYADYNVNLGTSMESAVLVMRVAIDSPKPLSYEVLMDGILLQTVRLDPTGGYGYTEKEWRCYSIRLGKMEAGRHTLRFRPSQKRSIVNIDCLALGKVG